MTYVCVRCKKTWVVGEPSDEYSGGLCSECTTDYVRKKQKMNGFHDCFRRAKEVCSRTECRYWFLCNRGLPDRPSGPPT